MENSIFCLGAGQRVVPWSSKLDVGKINFAGPFGDTRGWNLYKEKRFLNYTDIRSLHLFIYNIRDRQAIKLCLQWNLM